MSKKQNEIVYLFKFLLISGINNDLIKLLPFVILVVAITYSIVAENNFWNYIFKV